MVRLLLNDGTRKIVNRCLFPPGEIVQARSVEFRAHTQFLCGLRERFTQAGRGIPVTGIFGIRPGGSARSREDRTVEFYIDRGYVVATCQY